MVVEIVILISIVFLMIYKLIEVCIDIYGAITYHNASEEEKLRLRKEALGPQKPVQKPDTFTCSDCKRIFPKSEKRKSDFDGRPLCQKCYDADAGRIVNARFFH